VKDGLIFFSVPTELEDDADWKPVENARYILGPVCRTNLGRTGRQLTMMPVAISASVHRPITMIL